MKLQRRDRIHSFSSNFNKISQSANKNNTLLLLMLTHSLPCVPHMRGIVDGGPAAVPGDLPALLRHENLLLPRQTIEQLQHRPFRVRRGRP